MRFNPLVFARLAWEIISVDAERKDKSYGKEKIPKKNKLTNLHQFYLLKWQFQ